MKNIDNFKELLTLSEDKTIVEVFEQLESFMTEKDISEIRNNMKKHLDEMKESIVKGLNDSTKSQSGMSGDDSEKVFNRLKQNKNILLNSLLSKILSYAIAVMEENQRMGIIVACPTAGACGIVPACIVAIAEEYNMDESSQISALLTAAGIGKLVAQKVALAGAVAGCQAECGVASAMAAGAVVQMMGGTNHQIINACALTLKNLLGLACDPIAGLVEVPCIKRNGFIAIHAICAAELSLAGVDSVVPFDEVVKAMSQIGDLMSPLLKETSEAGLARSTTGKRISNELIQKWH